MNDRINYRNDPRDFNEDSVCYFEWETVYKSSSKDELLRELSDQEKRRDLASGDEKHRYSALINELKNRESTSWFQGADRFVRRSLVALLLSLSDKFHF